MSLILWTVIGALVVLWIWAGILHLFAKADQPHLERERMKHVFGESDR